MTRIRVLLPLSCAALLALSGCGPGSLSTRGKVLVHESFDDSALAAQAKALPGLTFAEAPRTLSWRKALEETRSRPDLVALSDDRDLSSAFVAGLIADLGPYRARLASFPRMRTALAPDLEAKDGKGPFFFPLTIQPWGLFYNPTLLAKSGIAKPATLSELEAAFESLAKRGTRPLALGASAGWPALGLLAILDLRLGGRSAYVSELQGKSVEPDSRLLASLTMLEKWRDRRWLSADAAALSWDGALAAVEAGRAAFTYLPSSAWSRYQKKGQLGFAAFPKGSIGEVGELATIEGFALAASSRSREPALALLDVYALAGAPGRTFESWQLPAVVPVGGPETEGIRGTLAGIVGGATRLYPPLDRALSAEAAREARLAMTDFLRPDSETKAADLAARLAAALTSSAAKEPTP